MKQQQNTKKMQCHRIIRVIDLCEDKFSSGDMLCHCITYLCSNNCVQVIVVLTINA